MEMADYGGEVLMEAAEAPPGVMDGLFREEAKQRTRTRRTSLSLFEPSHYRRPTFSDANLPAVTAGGLDYVWEAPARATIPSSGERVRVPLSVDQYQVTAFYEATPSLSKVAYLKATVRNKGKRPVLAGGATVFVGGEFGGDVRLATTGPGGIIELPLGADEDVRLTHTLVPASETVGLISKCDRTRYTTTIEVGNYKSKPIRIHLFDQVPKTRQEEIEIVLGKTTPAVKEGPDEDGLLRWELDLAAGTTKKLEFSYRIDRPEDWRLRQQ